MYSICQVLEDKTVTLGSLDQAETIVGRDPRQGGFTVAAESVSREHAKFIQAANAFFFQDLGSTNGSWVNGVKCGEGELKLISIGDVLQLAECRLIVTGPKGTIEDQEDKQSGVWVFKGSDCKGFKAAAAKGQLLSLGGLNSDYDFDEEQFSLPSLVIESRNDRLVVFQRAMEIPAKVGQVQLEDERELFHNDNVVIADYRFVCVSHKNVRAELNPVFTEVREPEPRAETVLKTWENMDDDTKLLADKSKPSGGVFGRIDDTQAIREQEIEESVDIDNVQSAAYRKFEQRFVLMVLIFLVATIFTLALWWVLIRN